MVPPPFRNGRVTPSTAVPEHFEAFYRACLRRAVGHRLRSSDLMAEYADWSTTLPARHAINYRQMVRYMQALGHERIKSNGIQYLDVGLARDFPNLGDAFALAILPDRIEPGVIGAALVAIDGALDQLHRVRGVLTGETPRP